MKKRQVNAILVDQVYRRKILVKYICCILLSALISIICSIKYINNNKVQYIKYNETSSIDYKVNLKENKYFDTNSLEEDGQYISSLIDNITATFKYNLELEEKVDYKYSYYIESEILVEDKETKNSLYSKKEKLKEPVEKIHSRINTNILEEINIDYNHYNDIIKGFVNEYRLENVECNLKVKMYVKVFGSCESFKDSMEEETIVTLIIPLNENTVIIDSENDLTNKDNKVMMCTNAPKYNFLFITLGSIFTIITITFGIYMVKFEIATRSAESIYEKELKKILNNYRSYIQKANNQFDLRGYQILKIDTFNELLEIRDTLQQPILMTENKPQQAVYFIVPSNTKILYIYGLKMSDIRKQIKENSEKDEFKI